MQLEPPNRESYRFTGKEWDEETKLYYMSARYQNPETSRWVSSDPAGWELINPMEKDQNGKFKMRSGFSIVESINPYSYTGNNPIRFSDPTGYEMKTSGEFGEDYSKVKGASVDFHLGDDEVNIEKGEDKTIGSDVFAPEGLKIIEVGYDEDVKGNYIRGITEDGARYDFFHLDSTNVKRGDTVQFGDLIGKAGDTGVGGAHLHTAKSYAQGKAPEGAGRVIQAFNRDYVQPRTQRQTRALMQSPYYRKRDILQ